MSIDYQERRALYIITTRDMSPESREFMASRAKYAFDYARHVLKGRFEEGEDAIATNALFSYLYAIILHGRFPKGEITISFSKYDRFYKEFISGDHNQGMAHYLMITRDRSPEARAFMVSDSIYGGLYRVFIVGD